MFCLVSFTCFSQATAFFLIHLFLANSALTRAVTLRSDRRAEVAKVIFDTRVLVHRQCPYPSLHTPMYNVTCIYLVPRFLTYLCLRGRCTRLLSVFLYSFPGLYYALCKGLCTRLVWIQVCSYLVPCHSCCLRKLCARSPCA